MGFATTYSRAVIGMATPLVKIEVHISNGLPSFQIVGLPDTSVRESRDRVRSAIINSELVFPQTRLTVNLSPADIPKEGARYDLAIAVGILLASKQLAANSSDSYEFIGELGLNGEIRTVRAALPSVIATNRDKRIAILSIQDAHQANIMQHSNMLPADNLLQVFHHLSHTRCLTPLNKPVNDTKLAEPELCLSEVKGQSQGKRALEIAAAGQHNLLLLGSPGTGKSMLASRLIGLLPEMTDSEAISTAAIYSIAGSSLNHHSWKKRPYRCPHHTLSSAALVGGGSIPKPGEISLAQNGVLFLDELPEFNRKVLDALREPMETGTITISRAAHQAEFPAQFQLVTALNPSPTGHYEDGRCNKEQVLKYLNKISGPILDRIELQIEVANVSSCELVAQVQSEPSREVRKRVWRAREVMLQRTGKPNALMSNKEVEYYCQLSSKLQHLFLTLIEKMALSPRAYHKLLKVARTIADLSESDAIEQAHLAEAISYRAMDKLLAYLTKPY